MFHVNLPGCTSRHGIPWRMFVFQPRLSSGHLELRLALHSSRSENGCTATLGEVQELGIYNPTSMAQMEYIFHLHQPISRSLIVGLYNSFISRDYYITIFYYISPTNFRYKLYKSSPSPTIWPYVFWWNLAIYTNMMIFHLHPDFPDIYHINWMGYLHIFTISTGWDDCQIIIFHQSRWGCPLLFATIWGENSCPNRHSWSFTYTVDAPEFLTISFTYTRWFKVTMLFPNWRSLNPLKGSLNHPKKVTLNHQV